MVRIEIKWERENAERGGETRGKERISIFLFYFYYFLNGFVIYLLQGVFMSVGTGYVFRRLHVVLPTYCLLCDFYLKS